MNWKKVITEARSIYFQKNLAKISDTLFENTDHYKANINLTGGQAGIALFFFYYGLLSKNEKYSDKGFKILSDLIDRIGKGNNFISFAGGLAGIGWVIEHLVQKGFIHSDTNKVLKELDILMYESMMEEIRRGNYNYLHHALGMGLYFLGRLHQDKTKEYLKHLITELEFISEKNETGTVFWNSSIGCKKNVRGVQLGISHGMAGIVLFLSLVKEQGIEPAKTALMIKNSVEFILENQLDRNNKSMFPNWVIEGEKPGFSRLAWGYGDLGIAISLWKAGHVLKNKEWEKKSIQIFEHTAHRKNLLENAVVDSGLCHGTSGIALIYQRIYNYTGIKLFEEAARYWFDETLKMAKYEEGLAGYMMWDGTEKGDWKIQAGLLNGVAGVGLTLISALSEIEPAWDRCLLLS